MKIAIYGYGNLGRGVECAARQNPDMKLLCVFTRRDPAQVHTLTGVPVYPADTVTRYKDDIDVLVICGGSATDLPAMTPALARSFNVIDSYDNHAHIPEHFSRVDSAARETGHTALICAGWDPGLFSLARLYASAVLPDGESYTFWGRGVSQGHSDAIRRVPGVRDARQYTVPVPEALERVRTGSRPALTTREKHRRECWVVLEDGADPEAVRNAIVTMPDYFEPYDTEVHFISQEELDRDHRELPHGGSVIRTGSTGLDGEYAQRIEYSLSLASNPGFTSSAILAFARAVYRMNGRGDTGCKTVLDACPADLSPLSPDDLRHMLL